MATFYLVYSLFVRAFLIWIAWNVFSKVYTHVKLIKRIRNAGIPTFRCYSMVASFPRTIRYILFGTKNLPAVAILFQMLLGMTELFKNEGMFRFDVSYLKQSVLVYTKEAVEAIFNDPREQRKAIEHKFVSDFVGEGLLTASYKKWKKHKRVLSPSFNSRILDSFQPVMYEHSRILVENIKSTLQRETLGFDILLAKCSLDIITETAMGVKFGAQSKKDIAYVTAVREVLSIIGNRVVFPWLWSDFIFRLSPSGLKLWWNMKTVHSFVREIISKKKSEVAEGPKKWEDSPRASVVKCRPFLELLLLHNINCKEVDRLTDEEILHETLTFTFAGFDTVSLTTYWTAYYLGLYPEVMKKAWAEVNTVLQGDKEREITVHDIKQMDYLENVIKETLRVRPTVPVLPRILRNDITIGNVTIPRGTPVAVCVTTLHRNKEVFPDGERFDPDRFKDAKISPFQYIPFSVGPRNCIGQRFAILEMKTVLSNMIRNLDWRSLDHEDKVLLNPEIVSRPHKPIRIRFWERP